MAKRHEARDRSERREPDRFSRREYGRADTRIREDVCDRLTDAPDIDASDIDVAVNNGEVTLSGTVRDRHQKRRSEDLIDNVTGVRDVHNNLRVARGQTLDASSARPKGRRSYRT